MPRANILSSGKMLLLHRKKFRCNNNFLCGFEEIQPGVYDLRNCDDEALNQTFVMQSRQNG